MGKSKHTQQIFGFAVTEVIDARGLTVQIAVRERGDKNPLRNPRNGQFTNAEKLLRRLAFNSR